MDQARINEVRTALDKAARLRDESKVVAETIRTMSCGLEVRAGTAIVFRPLIVNVMIPALQAHADALRAQADRIEAEL